jgi:hypothetical protein
MEKFMNHLKQKGFKGCPICGNSENFTWGHRAEIPGHEPVQIEAFIPGTTTVPGNNNKLERFNTQLIMLICDNCSYVMTFSKVFYHMYVELGYVDQGYSEEDGNDAGK